MRRLMKIIWRELWAAALGLLVLGAQGATPTIAEEPAKPRRIVSIGGDVTETLVALGMEAEIAAVDTTSTFPPEVVKSKKSVGYMRALSTEGILSIEPTLIIATAKSGPPEVVSALKASSIPFIEIDAEDSPAGVAEKVAKIAEAVGRRADGVALVASIEADYAALHHSMSGLGAPARALFVLSAQGGRVMVAGRDTSADALFGLAHAENAMPELQGFKPVSEESIIAAAPDFVVVMHRDGMSAARELAAMKGFADTPAVKNGRVIEVDGSYMLQFGPRSAKAALELMRKLHPEIDRAQGQ